jgi:hypothetical protein
MGPLDWPIVTLLATLLFMSIGKISFLWGSSPMQRPWRVSLRAKFSKATRLQFFRRLVLELDGNVAQTLELCATMESLDDHVTSLPVPAPLPVVNLTSRAVVSVELSDTALEDLNKAVSNTIQKRMELCFGGFWSWSDPIITSNDLNHLCDLMYDVVPKQVSAIMSMLGYDIKQKQAWYAHLVDKFYPHMTLFQLMSIASCVRNKKYFLLWSSIGAAIAYGCSSKYATQCIMVFFGYSCTTDTLLRSTLPFCNPDEYYRCVDEAMDSCGSVTILFEGDTAPSHFQVSIDMFDNSQRNQRLKFQRGGSSGHYVRLTSHA